MSLANLSYIGHYGNFVSAGEEEAVVQSSSAPQIKSLYNNAFDFEGTADILNCPSLLSMGNSEIADVGGSLTAAMDGSHNIKMLTFGLDTIFQAGQSGLFPNLEGLSIMKALDISSMMSGLKLPSVAALMAPGKKR